MWLKMTNPTQTSKGLTALILALALWAAPATATVPESEQLMYAGDVVNALAAAKTEAEAAGMDQRPGWDVWVNEANKALALARGEVSK